MTLAAVLCCATTMMAEPVSPSTARQAASRFLQGKGAVLKNEVMRAPHRALGSTTEGQGQTEASPYYVFNAKASRGFVIVSGDDCVGDNLVLGYTPQGCFDADAVPANMQGWLDEMSNQIAVLSRLGVKARAVALHDNVPHLLTSMWGQGSNTYDPQDPYNMLCPEIDGQLCYTGCSATSLAQVLYYHRWPQEPIIGELPAYTMANGRVIEALPSVAFDWDNMVDDYSQPTTEAQQTAVATLMRYCGQLLQMNYAPSGSGAEYQDLDILVNQFGIDQGIYMANSEDYSVSGWDELLYRELKEGRPIVHKGVSTYTGHSFVIDGYEVYDGCGYFHVNWGWNGSDDGFYKISMLNSGTDDESNYSCKQYALIGLQPAKNPPVNYGRYLTSHQWNTVYNKQPHYFAVINTSCKPGTFTIALAERNADGTPDYSRIYGEQDVEMEGYSNASFVSNAKTGTRYIQLPGNVTGGLAPGSHKLVFVNKEVGTDAPWKPIFGPNCCVEIIIDEEGHPTDTLYHPQPLLTAMSFKFEGLNQSHCRQDITATITNNGEDFIGMVVGAVYYVENGKLVSVLTHSFINLMMEAGSTTDRQFSMIADKAGEYVVVLMSTTKNLKGHQLSDIKNSEGYISHKSFTIDELQFSCEDVSYVEKLDEDGNPLYGLSLTLYNKTPMDYSAAVVVKFYNSDGEPLVFLDKYDWVSMLLDLAADECLSATLDLFEALKPGEYRYEMLIANDFTSLDLSDYFVFHKGTLTVQNATGISDVNRDTRSNNNCIFDLQGRSVEASSLKKGIYIRNGKKHLVK